MKNFTNVSYVDEDEPLLSSTAQNKDEAANDIDGVETASLDAQVAHLTAKQPDSDLLAAIAQDLDVSEKTGSAIRYRPGRDSYFPFEGKIGR